MYRLAIAAAGAALCACSAPRPTVEERIEVCRSVRVVRDSAVVRLPEQTASEVTADSVSVLETDCAVAEARIRADGRLSHTLRNKPVEIAATVERTEERTDTLTYRRPAPQPERRPQMPRWLMAAAMLMAALYFRPLITRLWTGTTKN